jgi:regulator of protease activity HflC (stomatin/prohibitin superfamily)
MLKNLIKLALILVVLVFATCEAFKWTVMRVYVPPGKALKVTHKFGKPLPPELIAVPRDWSGYKGVQEELLGPGRYFLNPVTHDWDLVDLVTIPAGDPSRWEWDSKGRLTDPQSGPMIGLVSARQGKPAPDAAEVVDVGYKGIQKDVLTPGVYKLNPHVYEVNVLPAVVVPPGSVGVVTRLVGTTAAAAGPAPATTQPSTAELSRIVSDAHQRGVLRDVLQPGVYYKNPRVEKVDIVAVGYDQITTRHSPEESPDNAIKFYSYDGYLVEADFTVVWGRSPNEAPKILASIGNTEQVEANIISPAMKAACQNVGANYTAKELIQGITRSKFQDELSASLEQQVQSRNVHILLALVRNVTVKDKQGQDATNGLLATIQRTNIEVENQLTFKQKTDTARVKARLDAEQKLVDVAKETVTSDTAVKVANIFADAQKMAAEIDAQRQVDVASIQAQVAALEAQTTQILGKAQADVDRMKNEAEAKGAQMMVQALGSAQAYNMYIFAKNFEPKDVRLIFAGQGTFWTDLKSFQEVGGATQVMDEQSPKKPPVR